MVKLEPKPKSKTCDKCDKCEVPVNKGTCPCCSDEEHECDEGCKCSGR